MNDYMKDAERYLFITDDHADSDVRRAVSAVCDAIVIRGKGATDAAIDAMREGGEVMKIKTSELIGPALDWAVSQCEEDSLTQPHLGLMRHCDGYGTYSPSTDWAQGGPIIDRERISVCWEGTLWVGSRYNETEGRYWAQISGPTPLVAAMRCYVASKLGNEVDVPKCILPR